MATKKTTKGGKWDERVKDAPLFSPDELSKLGARTDLSWDERVKDAPLFSPDELSKLGARTDLSDDKVLVPKDLPQSAKTAMVALWDATVDTNTGERTQLANTAYFFLRALFGVQEISDDATTSLAAYGIKNTAVTHLVPDSKVPFDIGFIAASPTNKALVDHITSTRSFNYPSMESLVTGAKDAIGALSVQDLRAGGSPRFPRIGLEEAKKAVIAAIDELSVPLVDAIKKQKQNVVSK